MFINTTGENVIRNGVFCMVQEDAYPVKALERGFFSTVTFALASSWLSPLSLRSGDIEWLPAADPVAAAQAGRRITSHPLEPLLLLPISLTQPA
ncbi:hypothetical protein MRX96_041990 [Rhipicephalus microplus]